MDYDLIVIGAGWAGFNAARRAKGLGLKVALIEKEKIGGTCLNRGCIPTKTLIHSARVHSLIKKSKTFGVEVSASPTINFTELQNRKTKLIEQLRQGMEFMLRGIDFFNEEARVLSANVVKLASRELSAKYIVLATGSEPASLKGLEFDGRRIVSSDEILNLSQLPPLLLIVGGGVIGCEFASLFSSLGSKVCLIEYMPQLLPGQDKEVAKKLETVFKKKGIQVMTSTDASSQNLAVYDLVLVCVGRKPKVKSLGLEGIGVELKEGRIFVDDYLKTSVSNIYAAGDCCSKVMLAHLAAEQGRLVAENIASSAKPKKVSALTVPSCIFTDPEVASIGLAEEEARQQGITLKINKAHFLGSGMAHILDETEGFVKLISDEKSGQLIGASIIGPKATELIGILSLALSANLKTEVVLETVFAHPTLSECIHDALKSNA